MLSKTLLLTGAFGFLATAALAQPAAPPPTDDALYVSAAALANLVNQGRPINVLSKGDKYIAEVATAGTEIEVHQNYGDLLIVLSGNATVTYGGTVTGNKEATPGEWRGGTMTGGRTAELRVGDYFHIPAGMPHQTVIPKGVNFKMMMFKIAP